MTDRWLSPLHRDLAASIATTCEIDAGTIAAGPTSFWLALSVNQGGSAKGDLTTVVRSMFGKLGIAEDDDFFEDDEKTPSLTAYEAVLDAVRRTGGATAADAETDEDDDDVQSIGDSLIAKVPPLNWTIKTALERIKSGTLVLNPEWQRGFVWKPRKQRMLIESILLGLPIPSFLLFKESRNGKYYVIDGRQRLETISRFCSPRPAKGEPKERFKTFNSKTPGWRHGEQLHSVASKYFDDFPADFRTSFEDVALVTFTFDDIALTQLYQIFKRYNTGAVALNAAEIRNAVYQATPLHKMLFRLAGELADVSKYIDGDERGVGENLRAIIPKGKRERYGAYDFVGRYFAFRYQVGGTVAAATNAFMEEYKDDASQIEQFRLEFIRSFTATADWYEYPLVDPREGGGDFHALLATLQLVSTTTALEWVDAGAVSEDEVRQRVISRWFNFAAKVLSEKQNSTLFWRAQADWIQELRRP